MLHLCKPAQSWKPVSFWIWELVVNLKEYVTAIETDSESVNSKYYLNLPHVSVMLPTLVQISSQGNYCQKSVIRAFLNFPAYVTAIFRVLSICRQSKKVIKDVEALLLNVYTKGNVEIMWIFTSVIRSRENSCLLILSANGWIFKVSIHTI